MQPPQLPNNFLAALASEMLKSTPIGSFMGLNVRETPYMTKPEPYTITKRIPGRGIWKRIKATRQVPSDEIIILNNSTLVAHPRTIANLKDQLASQFTQHINAVILTNLERSILFGQQNK